MPKPAEAYRCGEIVVIVHRRTGGQVYFHRQHIDADFIPFTCFWRMPVAAFDRAASRHERFDTRTLPVVAAMRLDTEAGTTD